MRVPEGVAPGRVGCTGGLREQRPERGDMWWQSVGAHTAGMWREGAGQLRAEGDVEGDVGVQWSTNGGVRVCMCVRAHVCPIGVGRARTCREVKMLKLRRRPTGLLGRVGAAPAPPSPSLPSLMSVTSTSRSSAPMTRSSPAPATRGKQRQAGPRGSQDRKPGRRPALTSSPTRDANTHSANHHRGPFLGLPHSYPSILPPSSQLLPSPPLPTPPLPSPTLPSPPLSTPPLSTPPVPTPP